MAMPTSFNPAVFRAARRAAGMTQSDAARRIGAAQSAVSMFEGGRRDALAEDKLLALAAELGIDPAASGGAASAAIPVPKYCPVQDCPRNVPFVVAGRLCVHVSITSGPSGCPSHCRWCGEVLEERCSNASCGAPAAEGACCVVCGTPFIEAAVPAGIDPRAYSAACRGRIRELRVLTDPEAPVRGAGPPPRPPGEEF